MTHHQLVLANGEHTKLNVSIRSIECDYTGRIKLIVEVMNHLATPSFVLISAVAKKEA